jgi:CRP-like cAMP-binding protein
MKDAHLECLLGFFDGAFIEVHPTGKPLIVENDQQNSKAYVLLRGEVGILQSGIKAACKKTAPFGKQKEERLDTIQKTENRHPSANHEVLTGVVSPKNASRYNIEEEERTNSLYCGLDNHVKGFLRSYGILVNRIQVGHIFGEIALVTKSPRSASAVTLKESEFLVFSRKNFLHLMKFYTADYISKKMDLDRLWPAVNLIEDNKKISHLVQSFNYQTHERVSSLDIGNFRCAGRKDWSNRLSCAKRCTESLQRDHSQVESG